MGELESLMLCYQQGDATATSVLIRQLSPMLLRFFASQSEVATKPKICFRKPGCNFIGFDILTGRANPSPLAYAIARHVKVDNYRRSQRIRLRELRVSRLPEPTGLPKIHYSAPDFDSLMAFLPPGQREVVTILKSSGLSLEEVARATASSVGSVKLKAHRAYKKLRDVLKRQTPGDPVRSDNDVV